MRVEFQITDVKTTDITEEPLSDIDWIGLCEVLMRKNAAENGPWPAGFFLRTSETDMKILYYPDGDIPETGEPIDGFLEQLKEDQQALAKEFEASISVSVTIPYCRDDHNRWMQRMNVLFPDHKKDWTQEFIIHKKENDDGWTMSRPLYLR